MRNLILPIVAAAVAFTVGTIDGNAAERMFSTVKVGSPSITLSAALDKICDGSTFALSDKAIVACASNKMPRLAADGSAFVNTGLGVEFNTLARQINRTVAAQ